MIFGKSRPAEQTGVDSEYFDEEIQPRLKVVEPRTVVQPGERQSALGLGSFVEGSLTFDTPARLDGHVNGELVSSSTLTIGEYATIAAEINVQSLIVFGQVVGDVLAADLVELKRGSSLEGNVTCKRIVVEEDAQFNGRVKHAVN